MFTAGGGINFCEPGEGRGERVGRAAEMLKDSCGGSGAEGDIPTVYVQRDFNISCRDS